MRWTPLMTWLLVAVLVWLGAPISGTSLNPARSFGPSLVEWFWNSQWLYWVAPPLGGLGAVAVFYLMQPARHVLTAKLFHVPHYPCIFKNMHVPHIPKGAGGVWRSANRTRSRRRPRPRLVEWRRFCGQSQERLLSRRDGMMVVRQFTAWNVSNKEAVP